MVLCLGSLCLAVGTFAELLRRTSLEEPGALGGAQWLFCERESTTPKGALWFWSYLYYLSKYYELLDTVLQLLKVVVPYPCHYH